MALKKALAGAAGVGLLLASCSSTQTPEQMTVAAFDFNENRFIAEVYALVLENAGIEVERSYTFADRKATSAAFGDGLFELVPEYLGSATESANLAINGEEAQEIATGDVAATAAAFQTLLEPFDVVVGEPAQADNELEFAVRAEFSEEQQVTSLSELATVAEELAFGGPPACETARFCLPGLKEVYGLEFASFTPLDTGGPNTLNALEVGDIDVAMVFDTDPAVDQRGFVVLEDDRDLQVTGNIVPLLASEAASDEVLELLASVGALLTTDELRAANGRVSIEGYPAEWVAASWAAGQGLIPAEAVPAEPTPTPPPSPTPPPPPEPDPEPEPEPEVAPAAPAPPPSGGGYARNAGEPSANAVSRNWPALAQCESGGNPTIISSNGLYHGLYQFSVPTWQAVGGSGAASSASPDEQTYRAQILYDRAGPGQWPVCGANL
jgi:osmoprotectant transport system substrate-binding protein